MQLSARTSIPYPDEYSEEWYSVFEQLIEALDGHHFAGFEDRNLFYSGGGTWAWDATSGLLSWSGTLRLNTPSTGLPQDLVAGAITLVDGEMLVVDVTRGATVATSLSAGVDNVLNPDDAVLALCLRSGSKLYFRNGVILADGASLDVFETGTFTARPVDSREYFIATPGQVLFTLSLTPDADCIPMVFVQGVLAIEGAGDDYQISGSDVTFNVAVTTSERVTVHYWT